MRIDQSPDVPFISGTTWAKLKSSASLRERKVENRILCCMKLLCVPPDLPELTVLL